MYTGTRLRVAIGATHRRLRAPECPVLWNPPRLASTLRCARLLKYAHAMLERHMGHPLSPIRIFRLKMSKRVTRQSLVPCCSTAGSTRPSVCMNRRPAVHRCRTARSAATLPRCVPRAVPSRVVSVRDRRVSAGALGSPAWGANQARVARGRRELPAAAPTPLLRCSPLQLVKEPITFAHAASHRSSGRAQARVNPSAYRLEIQPPRMALRCTGLWLGSRANSG